MEAHDCLKMHPRLDCHTSGPDSPCCNVICYPCPSHFSDTMSEMVVAIVGDDQPRALLALNHLCQHNWTLEMVMTWCALIRDHAPHPGQSPQDALDSLGFAPGHGESMDSGRFDRSWTFRLELLIRSAILGDGATILDTVATVVNDRQLPPQFAASLLSSLALAAHDSVEQHPQVGPETIAVYHVLGSQTMNGAGFNMLSVLAALTDLARTGAPEMLPDHLADRLSTADASELLSAVGIVGRALAQFLTVTPDGDAPLVVTTDGGDRSQVTGILDWRDAAADAHRPDSQLVWARGMRVAYAFARGDVNAARDLIADADDASQFCTDAIIGCCSMIGQAVAATAAGAQT